MAVRDIVVTARDRLARRREPEGRSFQHPDLHAHRVEKPLGVVGVLVYQGVTTAEIDRPVRKLAEGLHADVVHIGIGPDAVSGVELVRTVHIDVDVHDPDLPRPDVLVIPGGLGWKRVVEDPAVLTWIAYAAGQAQGVLAISTGSLILASAGRLAGETATGHWLAKRTLSELGAEVSTERMVQSENERLVTASGAMAAADVAPAFAERLRWGPA